MDHSVKLVGPYCPPTVNLPPLTALPEWCDPLIDTEKRTDTFGKGTPSRAGMTVF